MGYLKIWVHIIWTTKNRELNLTNEIRDSLFNHIKENAKNKDIYIDTINGFQDHVHCLISLKSGQTIDKIVMLLKGESSFWLNKNHFLKTKFDWQDQYYAVSVSESNLSTVRNYINNQENHHQKNQFSEEYNNFIKEYGFDKIIQG